MHAAYREAYNQLYGRQGQPTGQFRREHLPTPATYYGNHFGRDFPSTRKWVAVLCPFHDDHNPSMSINLDHGGFLCRGCDARGGDVLEFERQLHGLDFVAAAKALGAWR